MSEWVRRTFGRLACWLFITVSLTGCQITYRYSCEPSVKSDVETRRKYFLRSCRIVLDGNELPEHDGVSRSGSYYVYGFTKMERLRVQWVQPRVFSDTGIPVDVVAYVDSEKVNNSAFGSCSALTGLLTLGFLPNGTCGDREMRVALSVDCGKRTEESEFLMYEESCYVHSWSGLNRLFPYQHRTDVRFTCEGAGVGIDGVCHDRRDECRSEAYAYAIAATLAQMERDGKLSGVTQRQASQEKTEAKDKEQVASGRLLELRQLWDAGVISEEEYRREVKRLKSGGRGKEENK